MKIAPKTQDTIEAQSSVTAVFSLLSARMMEPLQSGCNKYTTEFSVYRWHFSGNLISVNYKSLNRSYLTIYIYMLRQKSLSALCKRSL